MSAKVRKEQIKNKSKNLITIKSTTINNPDEGLVAATINLESGSSDPLAIAADANTESTSKNLIKSKRRRPNPDGWKRNIQKQLRQAGKEYVNTNGQVTAERRVKPACGSTCYLKCAERFSENQRQTIHNSFWQLTDEQKNYFYWKFTSRCEPKRRRTISAIPKRAYTFHYRFEVRGELMTVCSKFFFATLDITSIRIYYFYEHCYRGDICMPRELKRDKPYEDLTNLAERLDAIREHIASFPSERLSGVIKKRYLAADLNLARMYKMYTKNVVNPLKQHWYCRAFNEEFHLEFRLPTKKNTQNNETVGIQSNRDENENVSFISSDCADIDTVTTQLIKPRPTTTTSKPPVRLAQEPQPTARRKLPVRLPEEPQPAKKRLHAQSAQKLLESARELPVSAPQQRNETNIPLSIPNLEVHLPTNPQKVCIKQGNVDTENGEVEVRNVPVLVQVPASIISTPFTTLTTTQLVEPQPVITSLNTIQLAQQLPLPQLQPATVPLQWNGSNITLYSNYGWNQRY